MNISTTLPEDVVVLLQGGSANTAAHLAHARRLKSREDEAHDMAMAQRVDQLVDSMLAGDHSEDLWQYIDGVLARARSGKPACADALDDMCLRELIAAAASARAQAKVEEPTIEGMARDILDNWDRG